MSINIHILQNSKDIKPFIGKLKSITKSSELLLKKVILLGDIDIVFYVNPEATLKDTGIGGYTPCANAIFISIDPNNPKFKDAVEKELPYTLTHEINHAIRFRTPIQKETLFEAMISEGLADHFAIEITKRKKPQDWSDALTKKQKNIFFKKALKEYNLLNYDHNAWFYGSKEKRIPRFTAYTLGYDLVSSFLQKHTEVSASEIISADASIFV